MNAILALGCHFTSHPLARLDPENPDTVGDHFFKECKRLILENDEHETSRLTTVQALALMSVREAGCGREDKGWSYSGMSFRMGIEMGLHLDLESRNDEKVGEESKRLRPAMSDEEIDARRVTFWGCFLFDKYVIRFLASFPHLSYVFYKALKNHANINKMLVELHGTNAATSFFYYNCAEIHHYSFRGRSQLVSVYGCWSIVYIMSTSPNQSDRSTDLGAM